MSATVPASPCLRCGTTAGYVPPDRRRPTRCRGLCRSCHGKMVRAADPPTRPPRPAPPCADCGTTAGRVVPGCVTPVRCAYGFAGPLCDRCYARRKARRDKAEGKPRRKTLSPAVARARWADAVSALAIK